MTADLIARKTQDNRQVERWLLWPEDAEPKAARFVDDLEGRLSAGTPHLLVVLRLRRQYRDQRGRLGWVSPVQARFPDELAAVTGLPAEDHWKSCRNTFHLYWRELLDLAAREAIRQGLLV